MDSSNKKPSKIRKVMKYIFRGILLLIVGLVVWFQIYKYSGSDEWEYQFEKKGVKMYTLKTPGRVGKQFRGTVRFNAKLNQLAAAMHDTDVETCNEWVGGCESSESIEEWNSEGQYYIQYYKSSMPDPFKSRELVLKTTFTQDPATKELLIRFMAVPNEIPLNKCCVRVYHLRNQWRFTPLENGQVELEFTDNSDMGGYFPDLMINKFAPNAIASLLAAVPRLVDKDKYKNIQYEYVQEKS